MDVGVKGGTLWKEDEIHELLTYYRKKLDEGFFNMQHTNGKWGTVMDHINNMFWGQHPDHYVKKTQGNISDKIRHCRDLYKKNRSKFAASMRLMTETGRETEDLDQEKCQQAWAGWALYHSVFHDDPSVVPGTFCSQVNFPVCAQIHCTSTLSVSYRTASLGIVSLFLVAFSHSAP